MRREGERADCPPKFSKDLNFGEEFSRLSLKILEFWYVFNYTEIPYVCPNSFKILPEI